MSTDEPHKRPAAPGLFRRRATWIWIASYAAMLAVVVIGLLQVRSVTLATMGTPEARAEWQAWREAPPNQREDLPVRRKPPSSEEPPALVLMRDYFGVMLSGAVLFGSLLFAALAIALRGVFSPSSPPAGTKP